MVLYSDKALGAVQSMARPTCCVTSPDVTGLAFESPIVGIVDGV